MPVSPKDRAQASIRGAVGRPQEDGANGLDVVAQLVCLSGKVAVYADWSTCMHAFVHMSQKHDHGQSQ